MSTSPNREELLKMAVRSVKQENTEGAKVLFQQVLAEDPHNERAMLWMAKISKNSPERRAWLERVLQTNPDNDTAQTALAKMNAQEEASENQKAVAYGSIAVGTVMVIILIFTAVWALIVPLSYT